MSTYKVIPINNNRSQLVDSGVYADIRFDPDSASPDYIGLHLTNGADTSDSNWKIYKFSDTRIQFIYGAWDNRVSLF